MISVAAKTEGNPIKWKVIMNKPCEYTVFWEQIGHDIVQKTYTALSNTGKTISISVSSP